MATIVTQYDPWREKLAANLGIGLLSDALTRGREADAQRKNNALYTKTLEDLGLLGEQTQPFADPLMNSQTLPDGYNDNGWAKTMHDSYTPMTQFNMGTAGLTEPAPQPKIPTQMDMMRALAANIAGPRFNMVNFNDVYTKMFQPTMAAAEADYKNQLAEKQRIIQQQFSDALLGAGNRDTYGEILNAYMASGYAPKDTANAMQKNYEHLYPNMKDVLFDAGGTIYPATFNPSNGSYIPTQDKNGNMWGITKSATPDQLLKTGFDYDKLNREMEFKYYDSDRIAGQNDSKNFLAYQKQAMEQLEKDEKGINEELIRVDELINSTDDPNVKAEYESYKQQIQSNLNNIRQRKNILSNELMYNGGFAQRPQWTAGETVSPMVRGHSATINKWARHYGVDPDLLATIMQIESNGNPNMNGDGTTVSKAGARGVMQVMPKTARNLVEKYGLNPDILNKLDDTDTNVMLSALLVSELQRQYGAENLDAILGAYNGGGKGANPKTRVDETRKYVAKGNAVYQRLKGVQPPRMAQSSIQQQQAEQKTAKDDSPVIYRHKNGAEISRNKLDELLKDDPNAIEKLKQDGFYYAVPSPAPYATGNYPFRESSANGAPEGFAEMKAQYEREALDNLFTPSYSPGIIMMNPASGIDIGNNNMTQNFNIAPAGKDALFGNSIVPDVLFDDVHNDYTQYTPEQLKRLHDMAMYYLGNEQDFLDPLTQSLPLRRRSPFEGAVPYPLFFGKPLY